MKKILLSVLLAGAFLCNAGYLRIGASAPEFAKAPWLKGKSISIAAAKGKKMVAVLFWKPDHASALGIRTFSTVAHKHPKGSVEFAAVGEGQINLIAKFPLIAQLGNIPLLIDSESRNVKLFLRKENRLPMAVLIGKDGKLLWRGNPGRLAFMISSIEKGKYDARKVIGDDDFNAVFTGMIAKSDFKGALALLEKEFSRPGVNPREIVSLQVGILYRRLNSPEKAVEAIHKAQKRFPRDAGFYEMELKMLELGHMEKKLGEFYFRLVSIFKNQPDVLLRFVTYEMNRPFGSMNPANIYTVARAAANASSYRSKRERGKALLFYAQSLYCLGREDLAAKTAERSLKYLKGEREYKQAEEMAKFYRKLVRFSPQITE